MNNTRCNLSIEGMTCVTCVRAIEKALKEKRGVFEARVNFATNEASVDYDPEVISEESLVRTIQGAGYDAQSRAKTSRFDRGERESNAFKKFILAALLTLPLMLEMIGMLSGFPERLPVWIQATLATIVQFWCGWPFYTSSYYSLKAKSANMDLLIALGTSAAFGFSLVTITLGLNQPLYFESSAMIITLVLLGRWLEASSKKKASRAIQKLLSLTPDKAKVKRDGDFLTIPIEDIKAGDHFLARPGDTIAVDGVVVDGESAVNESTLTGESLPIYKGMGDKVFAGTNNTNGSMIIEATGVGAETVLSRMVKLVEEAQNSRAPIQRLADRISEVFVPAVVLVSALTFLIWILAGSEISQALINAVAVLVIACPCALGLATPTVIMVASGRGAEIGILFKEARALEVIQRLDLIVADKTGTLTKGKPVVQDVIAAEGSSREDVLVVAASLAHLSSHPLSDAIVNLAKKETLPIEPIHQFESVAGKGLKGTKRGSPCALGSPAFARDEGIAFDDAQVTLWQQDGKTASIVWKDAALLGYLLIEDEIRETTPRAVELLHERGLPVVMITGDSQAVGEAVGSRLNLDHVYAGVMPEEKAKQVQEIKNKGLIVGMVGDGVNDAPALATAHVGFAIDYGSDVAIEASDITLLGGDLMGVVKAIDLSKATYRKIKQNLFFAFFYNCLGIPLAALGFLNPIIAAAAMAASSLSVISNALLLRKWKPKL